MRGTRWKEGMKERNEKVSDEAEMKKKERDEEEGEKKTAKSGGRRRKRLMGVSCLSSLFFSCKSRYTSTPELTQRRRPLSFGLNLNI